MTVPQFVSGDGGTILNILKTTALYTLSEIVVQVSPATQSRVFL